MGLVDGAIDALLRMKAPARVRAQGDPHIGRDDGRGATLLCGSLAHPFARPRGLGRQHPVQQNAIADRATEAAQPRSHRSHHDARGVGQQRAKLGHRPLERIDLPRQRTGPDAEPQPRRIEPEAVDFRRDLGRLIAVQRQHPHAELHIRGGRGELSKRVQPGSGRLVV